MHKYYFKCYIKEKDLHIEKYCSTEKEVLQNYFFVIGDIKKCIRVFAEYKRALNLVHIVPYMKNVFGFRYRDEYNYLVIKQEEILIGSPLFVEKVKIKDSYYEISVDRDSMPTISFYTGLSNEERSLLSQRIDNYFSSIIGVPLTKATMTEIALRIESIVKECMRW